MFTTRRLGAAVLAAVTLISLTGCGSKDHPPVAKPKPSASTESTSPSTSPSPAVTAPTPGTPQFSADPKTNQIAYCKDQKPFTGPASDQFGADKVMSAYCEMVQLTMDQSFIPNMVRQQDGYKAVEFSIPGQYMTPGAKKDWDAAVQKIVNDPSNTTPVWPMMFTGIGYNTFSYYPESSHMPTVLHQSFTAATTGVDTQSEHPRLTLSFTVSADIVQTKDGDPYLVPVGKTVTYWLVPNPGSTDKPWMIDGYQARYNYGKPVKHPEIKVG